MNTHTALPFQLSRRAEWLILAAILLAAAFLRLYRLDAIPPGWDATVVATRDARSAAEDPSAVRVVGAWDAAAGWWSALEPLD